MKVDVLGTRTFIDTMSVLPAIDISLRVYLEDVQDEAVKFGDERVAQLIGQAVMQQMQKDKNVLDHPV